MSERCPYCIDGTVSGSGSYPPHKCPDCGGTGYIREEGVDYWVCDECGREFDNPLEDGICDSCREKSEE